MTRGLEGIVSLVTGGVQGIGKVIAQRLAPEGPDVALNVLQDGAAAQVVRGPIAAIAPGAIETPVNAHRMNTPLLKECQRAPIAERRTGTPGELAGVAGFLASLGADDVTGATTVAAAGRRWNWSKQ